MNKEKLPEAYGDVDLDMLADFTLTNGISGHERDVADVYKHWVEDSVDTIEYDNLGSIIAIKEGTVGGPKIMLAGHTDEIGFVVKSIDDNGFIRMHPVGGWWAPVLPSQPVTIKNRDGLMYVGIIASRPPHGMSVADRNKPLEIKDLYIDMGVDSKAQIDMLGIQIGDSITPKADFHVLANPNYLMSKAWDDRIGLAVVANVMRNLKDIKTDSTIYGVGTVQEEVGLRGAKTAAYKIDPDVAITLDVTVATDTPNEDNRIKMGVGATLEVMDSSYIGHKGLLYLLEDLCGQLNIDYQLEVLAAGGTDSGEIHKIRDGVIALTVSIPARYIHSHLGIIHRKDFADTVTLLTEFCSKFDSSMLHDLTNYKRHDHES